MKIMRILTLVCVLLCVVIPIAAFAADVETTITPKKDFLYVQEGKTADIKLTVAPRTARAKGVTYESDNEEIATVTSRGRVKGIALGTCNITVTSKYDGTSIQIPVTVIVPAKKIEFEMSDTTVRVGDQLELDYAFSPEDTTVQQATFKSTNTRLATVDEKGVVTGVKAGKVSIVATAADGSNARGKVTITVIQPVTGVSYKTPHVRVGVNYHGSFTAALEPKNATNHNMTWQSADESIATISGSTNKMRIDGHKWGQTTVTGTTEDGEYQVSITVDIGSLRHAVRINELKMSDGKPRITFKNNSNLNITQVRYLIRGYDSNGNPVQMSRDQATLKGTYDIALAPNDYTQHGLFNFVHKTKFENLAYYELAITGWSTDTGYYNNKGELLYNYNLSESNYEWIESN